MRDLNGDLQLLLELGWSFKLTFFNRAGQVFRECPSILVA